MSILAVAITVLRRLVGPRAILVAENLALRHQLAVLLRHTERPTLRPADRRFWVTLSRCSPNWRAWLVIVQPATVVAWHRQGFRLFWRWRSRSRGTGRPAIDARVRDLIQCIARENPT